VRYASADGVWELWYPATWVGPYRYDYSSAEVANFRVHEDEVEVPIGINLDVSHRRDHYRAHAADSVADLLPVTCEETEFRAVLECKKVNINSRAWAWGLIASSDPEAPGTWIEMRTIVGETIYFAGGFTSKVGNIGLKRAIPQIREVLESIVLRV